MGGMCDKCEMGGVSDGRCVMEGVCDGRGV